MDEITFDRERKIQVHSDLSKVALSPSSDAGRSRPVLATVLYDAADSSLVAANGFSMARVDLEDQPLGNEDCLIPAEALKMAYQTRKPLELSDCGQFFRVGTFLIAVPKDLHFPSWRAIAEEGKIARRFLVALDTELLWRLVSALRGRSDNGHRYNLVVLSQATRDGIVRCQSVCDKDNVGYLMPVCTPQDDEDGPENDEP